MATTTRKAAPAVRLNTDWQVKYRQRAQLFLLQTQAGDGELQESFTSKLHLHQEQESAVDGKLCQSDFGKQSPPSVCVVGRTGVGKSSLINHLLQERAAAISLFDTNIEEQSFDYHGLLCLREIPGYDGRHASDSCSRSERFRRRFHRSSDDSGGHSSNSSGHSSNSSHSSNHSSSHGKGKKLNLDEFVQMYKLFEDDTKAIVFVVNCRITPDDEKLMELAVEKRKFFCIVYTGADNLVMTADSALQKRQLDELEEQVRKDLSLLHSLNVRFFILSIPFPEAQATDYCDVKCLVQNIQKLHFPLLQAYLSQPKGLLDEIQIHSFVKEEVWEALEPFINVKKRHQALDFSQHLVAGTLVPILGPVMVSFLKTMRYTLKACSALGLIEDADAAMEKVNADAKKHGLSAMIASKEGMITAVHDSMIHIFGKIVFELAIAEVVSAAAEAAVSGALPFVGPVISAAHLPSRFKKIGEKLRSKACMLHELWIMQNITGLLGSAQN